MTTKSDTDRLERRAVTYLRVSSKRQMDTAADIDPEGNSIATQREACLAKADKLGATVVHEFVEPGTSAQTIEKRPVFRQLLAYLAENNDIDYVVIYMRSRAFRNLGDAVLTKRRLEHLQIKLVSAKEDFGEGIMADAMEAVTDIINEVQVRMSGEDIKVKMRHKAENGGTVSRAKLGYKNIRIEHEGRLVNTIGLDEERAPLVRKAFELYATGQYSIERLHATIADQGLTTRPSRRNPAQPLALSQLHRLLSEPYYTGVVVYQGEEFPGRHEAIVSPELFDRVQEVLARRSGKGSRDRVHAHYLKGLLFCDRCRRAGRTSRMIYIEAKGRSRAYPYYFCRARNDGVCDLPHLPVHLVEGAVLRHYPNLDLGEEFTRAATLLLESTMADEKRTVHELHANYRARLKALEVQEERLIDLASDGELPKDRIRARLRKIQVDRARAQAGLRETGEQLAVGSEILLTYTRLLNAPASLYEMAPPDVRRQLNEAFYERLFIDDLGIVEGWPTQPFLDLTEQRRSFEGARSTWYARQKSGRQRRPGDVITEPSLSYLADLFVDDWVSGSNRSTVVGLTGFEPAASSSRTRRATKLRHSPMRTAEQSCGSVRNLRNHTGAREPSPNRFRRAGRSA